MTHPVRPINNQNSLHLTIEKLVYGGDGLARLPADNIEIELDVTDMSWEAIFQDIVRRSPSLRYVTATSAFAPSSWKVLNSSP